MSTEFVTVRRLDLEALAARLRAREEEQREEARNSPDAIRSYCSSFADTLRDLQAAVSSLLPSEPKPGRARVQVRSIIAPQADDAEYLATGWKSVGSSYVWEGPSETLNDLLALFRRNDIDAVEVEADA